MKPELPAKLTNAEELKYFLIFRRFTKGVRYEKAREMLVMSAMKEAVGYLRSRANRQLSDGELMSLAYRALNRSVLNFDPTRPGSTSFLKYSKPYLRGYLYSEWRKRDKVKNHEPLPVEPDDDEEDIREQVQLPADEPRFDLIHTHERWKLIEPMLGRLNVHEQEVVRLCYFLGKTLAEIAEDRGVKRQSIQATHARALLKLRRILIRKKLL